MNLIISLIHSFMNHKRAILFGAMLWAGIFTLFTITMVVLNLQTRPLLPYFIIWALMIPLTLVLAKWYFKMDSPTTKKGFCLGLIGVGVAIALDMVITVPLIVKSYRIFYTDWKLYAMIFEITALCTFAGWEFDKTYTAPDSTLEPKK